MEDRSLNLFDYCCDRAFQWCQPLLFRLAKDEDKAALEALLQSGKVRSVMDPVECIANNLFELEHPSQKKDEAARKAFLEQERFQSENFGVWVFFPWSGELVRYPEEEDYYHLRTYRYRNLLTKEELETLRHKRCAVIGMSVGSNVALTLIRNGLCGAVALADLVSPNVSNIGRAEFDMRDLCTSKLDAIAKRISHIDPFVEQLHLPNGLSDASLQELEDWHPDLVCDEVDDMKSSVHIRKFCRKIRAPFVSVSDVDDRVVLEICRFDQNPSQPLYAGMVSDKKAQLLLDGKITGFAEEVYFGQSIGFHYLSEKLVSSNLEIGKTLSGIPQLGTTSVISGGYAAAACRDILLNRKVKSGLSSLYVSLATKRPMLLNLLVTLQASMK